MNCLSLQCVIELTDSILLHGWHYMTVDIHCHADLVMPEEFLYNFRMNAHTQQNGGCSFSLSLPRFCSITATAPNGSQFNEALFTVTTGLAIAGGTNEASADHLIFTRSTPSVIRTAY